MSRQVVDDWQTDPWDDPGALYEFEAEPPPRKGRVVRWVAYGVLLAFVAAVLAGGAGGYWVITQINPSGAPGEPVNFTVAAGDDLDTIAQRLQDLGIITSARVFRWYANRDGGLEAQEGYYALRPRDNMGDLLERLRTPPAQTYQNITFPEGFTIPQIGNRLEEKAPRLDADAFVGVANAGQVRSRFQPENVNSLEGLLFPDTYQVAGNETEEDVATRMVKLMERVATREGIDDAPNRLGLSPYQVLVVASLIEREAKVPEDRPLIARVIYNRLFLGMPLQIDASLYYQQDPDTPFSTLKELDTPYNTYKVTGLPPTPIANPGRAAIRAALNPADNPDPASCPGQEGKKKPEPCGWLYYVLADADGRHAFATNLDDHERNVAKARAAGLLG